MNKLVNSLILLSLLSIGLVVIGVAGCAAEENDGGGDGDSDSDSDGDGDGDSDSDSDSDSDGDSDSEGDVEGYAKMTVPFIDWETQQQFMFYFGENGETEDLTGATVTFRVKVGAYGAGVLYPLVQNGEDSEYTAVGYAEGLWKPLSDFEEWTDLVVDVDAAAADEADFDPSAVFAWGLQISAGEQEDESWTLEETVLYLDSVSIVDADGNHIGDSPWTFDADIQGIAANEDWEPVEGSSIEHATSVD